MIKIETEEDYNIALNRIDMLMDIDENDITQDELDMLSYLAEIVEEYEDIHYPMD